MVAYPNTNLDRKISNWETKVDTVKKLRSFLIFYILKERNWLDAYLDEKVEKFLNRKQFHSLAFRECYALWYFYIMLGRDKSRLKPLLRSIYQDTTLRDWKKSGKSLFRELEFTLVPTGVIQRPVRRRGYAKTNKRTISKLKVSQAKKITTKVVKLHEPNRKLLPTSPISLRRSKVLKRDSAELRVWTKSKRRVWYSLSVKDKKTLTQRRISTMEEDAIRQRILLKQLMLFERQLDNILKLTDPSLPKEKKREMFRDCVVPPDSNNISTEAASEVFEEKLQEALGEQVTSRETEKFSSKILK